MANTEATPFNKLMAAIDVAFRINFDEPTSIYIGLTLWQHVMGDERSTRYLILKMDGIEFRGLKVYTVSNDLNHLKVT